MGVVHSMDEGQVSRVSAALRQSAESIQGINSKFDIVDQHWCGVQAFNTKINTRVEDTLSSFQRLDKTINARVESALDTVKKATDELTQVMESMVYTLQAFDMQREMNQLPKAVIPMMIPLIILMIELAIANAYLGILLTRLPEVSDKYSTYLVANAATVLLGLSLSLLWLGSYRGWLSYKTRQHAHLQRLQDARKNEDAGSESSGRSETSASGAAQDLDEVDKDQRSSHSSRFAATERNSIAAILRHQDSECHPGDGGALEEGHSPSSRGRTSHRVSKSLRLAREESSRLGGGVLGPRHRRVESPHRMPSDPVDGREKRGDVPMAVGDRSTSAPSLAATKRSGAKVTWASPFLAQVMWGTTKRAPSCEPASDPF